MLLIPLFIVSVSFLSYGSSCVMMLSYCVLTQHHFGGKQEQSDLMREIEALEAELKRSQEQMDKSHVEVSLHNFACLDAHL